MKPQVMSQWANPAPYLVAQWFAIFISSSTSSSFSPPTSSFPFKSFLRSFYRPNPSLNNLLIHYLLPFRTPLTA